MPQQDLLSWNRNRSHSFQSLVVACGVRKVWSKEFKDLSNPPAQIKRLKSILTELGMSGRMSMEQAKAIRARREFAQELEDVQDFANKVVGRSEGRSSRKKLGSGKKSVESSDEDEDDDEDDNEEDDKPRKKRIVCGFRVFRIVWLSLTDVSLRRTLEIVSVLSSRIKATRIRFYISFIH